MASLEAELATVRVLEEALAAARARVEDAQAREGRRAVCEPLVANADLQSYSDRQNGNSFSRQTSESEARASSKETCVEDQVKRMRAERAFARNQLGLTVGFQITLPKKPLSTIRLFILYMADVIGHSLRVLLLRQWVWVTIPILLLWISMKYHLASEKFSPPVCGDREPGALWKVEFLIKEAAWWILIGILSSVGLGKGLHTGRMFLFPHLMQVVHAAEGCMTTDGLVTWYLHPCKLDCSTTTGPKDGNTVTFSRIYLLVIVQCVLWGIGTALGELPPYAISRAARRSMNKASAKRLASLSWKCRPVAGATGFLSEVEETGEGHSLLTYMKVWTIDFIERRGFAGVLLLASWPNAMFDICGICCGFLVMPFWTFFFATLLGKSVIKVHVQMLFFLNIFGADFFPIFLSIAQYLNRMLTRASGKDFGLRQLAVNMRGKLVRHFELQRRIRPEEAFSNSSVEFDREGLTHTTLKQQYGNYDDSDAIAARVLKKWDKNKDGEISFQELRKARSRTDSKVSFGALDPGQADSWLKMCWELFGILLQVYYVFSIVDELAKAKQLELDELEVAQLKRKGEEDKKLR